MNQDELMTARVSAVKDLFTIAERIGALCEKGYLELQDAHEMAIQASQLGLLMWKASWKDLSREFPEWASVGNQKIDRGEHVVVK